MQFSMKKLLMLLGTTAVLAACSSTPVEETAIETRNGKSASDLSDPRAVPTVQPDKLDPLNDPQGVLAQRSIYFGLDEYSVSSEYRGLVQAHANYLASHPNQRVVIQGNTDERGGSEYNLALGQRRADAVKTLMMALGVGESQVETVSFGKEKPKAYGSNEAAWAENRRADIVYQ